MKYGPLQDKFIACVDILGFKSLHANAQAGIGLTPQEVLGLNRDLCHEHDRDQFEMHGPTLCPNSRHISKELAFRISQANDCALITTEVSPSGAINLINHCSVIVIRLLKRGVLARGYISRGMIYHSQEEYEGPGLEEVLRKERKVDAFKRDEGDLGTPFIELDETICTYIKKCQDSCVTTMFSRLVEDDGISVVLFPFKVLARGFTFGHTMDSEAERRSLDNIRFMINTLKTRVEVLKAVADPKATRRYEHYMRALEAQFAISDEYEAVIDEADEIYPAHTLGEIFPGMNTATLQGK